jgi:hypothetical protein
MIKRIIIALLFFNLAFLSNALNISNLEFLKGSSVYERVFLFFFPISYKYESFFNIDDDNLNLDIQIKQKDILKEPSTPSYFDSDVIFMIKDIPINYSNETSIPVTIQCNQKFIKKKAVFKIYRSNNILIIRGNINNLKIMEITGNEFFQNRFNWNLPIYFDLRFKIN